MTTLRSDTTDPTGDSGGGAPTERHASILRLRPALAEFVFDEPGAAWPFTARLIDETGWTRAYAEEAVREYLRFVELAVTEPHPVSPSVAVDRVWHLHLCYTRSYWDDLCGRVLGRPLHHEPSTGGAAEERRCRELYERTLVAYTRRFHEAPPRDIWPGVDRRFGRAPEPQRSAPEEPSRPSPATVRTVQRWCWAVGLACAGGILVKLGTGSSGFWIALGLVVASILAALVQTPNRGGGMSDGGAAACDGGGDDGCSGGCCGS